MNVKTETNADGSGDFVPLLPAGSEPPPARDEYSAEGKPPGAGDLDFFLSSLENEKNSAYLKGYAEGEKQTLGSMSGKLNEQIKRWTEMLAALSGDVAQSQKEFFDTIEERTVSVAVAVAEKLIGRELHQHPRCVVDRVREAVSRLRSEPAVVVRANPKDSVFLRQLVHPESPAENRDEASPPAPCEIELVEDPSVEAGGFKLETRLALYDHTINSLLRKVESDLTDLYEQNDS